MAGNRSSVAAFLVSVGFLAFAYGGSAASGAEAPVCLERIRWYDDDGSSTYTAGDRVELIFSSTMSNQTVDVSNLIVFARDQLDLGWVQTAIDPHSVFGARHSALVASNSPIYARTDSHFVVTLGGAPTAGYSYALNPSASVLSADGQPDATWPSVRFPRCAEGADSDGDGLADTWEIANGLSCTTAEGDEGWCGDPDRDGLINGYEFLASQMFEPDTLTLLDPLEFDSDGDGIGDYDDSYMGQGLTYGEICDDGDLLPDGWEAAHSLPWMGWVSTLSPMGFSALADEDYDGWSNLDEFLYEGETNGAPAHGTDPSDPLSHPEPEVRCTLQYDGSVTGIYHVVAYRDSNMDGHPLAHVEIAGRSFCSDGSQAASGTRRARRAGTAAGRDRERPMKVQQTPASLAAAACRMSLRYFDSTTMVGP